MWVCFLCPLKPRLFSCVRLLWIITHEESNVSGCVNRKALAKSFVFCFVSGHNPPENNDYRSPLKINSRDWMCPEAKKGCFRMIFSVQIQMDSFIHLFNKYLMILLVFKVFLYTFYSLTAILWNHFSPLKISYRKTDVLEGKTSLEKVRRFSEWSSNTELTHSGLLSLCLRVCSKPHALSVQDPETAVVSFNP